MTNTHFQWLQARIKCRRKRCLIWPGCRDSHGYAQLGVKGKVLKAHLVMCEWAHGPRPSPDHQASHSCGNGHIGCVNPNHLSWKTRRENHLDRRKHGTAATARNGRRGIVTVQMATEILKLRPIATQDRIARRFGISKPTVRRIFAGKTQAAKVAAAHM